LERDGERLKPELVSEAAMAVSVSIGEGSMNRGQSYDFRWLKSAWRLVLHAGILCLAVAGTASATNGLRAGPQPDRSWESYYGVAILPSGRAIVAGDKGVVMATDDGGRTWTRQLLKSGPKYYDLYSVAFTSDGSRGWVVGDAGVIFRTDDRGATWTEQNGPPGLNSALLKIAVADARRFCASGEHGVLLCTSDGGANWNLQKFHDIGFFDLVYTDPNNVWAVGEFATLMHSGDGGKTWQVRNGGEIGKGDPLFSIAFDGRQGLVVGLIGTSLQTSDGGKTWQERELAIGHRSLYTVSTVPGQAGEFYAAGEEGLAALISNGEVTPVSSGVADAIAASAFSPRFGLVAGLSGTLLRSDDAGRHWHSLLGSSRTLLSEAQ
jgi:photosystem II stability/assembly factor-like uncharacterized protein